MSALYAGIDPGKEGAICLLDADLKIVKYTLLRDCEPRYYLNSEKVQYVFIEKAQTMGRESAKAAFSYGRAYGYLCGQLADLPFKIYYIPPAVWSQAIHVMSPYTFNNTKECSLFCARKIWPAENFLASPKSRKAHDGIVDAALIAYYGAGQLKRGVKYES
jgi:hypothetical protein